ncbi:UPF0158 family protein [Flavobacterium sp.]|uniref:UPF0158 family protein n=1 Tax=Flavobacterium sp. TaxID=239 RepID=UPI00286DB6B7|nr:UPF0158 family protein [Flavobacterium sp.]
MKPLEKAKIKEIAEQFDCGFKCFWNLKNNELIFIPDEDNGFSDMEFWQDEIDELENNFDEFVEIEKPTSTDSFKMMEEFVASDIPNKAFKIELSLSLTLKKSFRNFKYLIDNSSIRDLWFAFKSEQLQKWVETEIELIIQQKN